MSCALVISFVFAAERNRLSQYTSSQAITLLALFPSVQKEKCSVCFRWLKCYRLVIIRTVGHTCLLEKELCPSPSEPRVTRFLQDQFFVQLALAVLAASC